MFAWSQLNTASSCEVIFVEMSVGIHKHFQRLLLLSKAGYVVGQIEAPE